MQKKNNQKKNKEKTKQTREYNRYKIQCNNFVSFNFRIMHYSITWIPFSDQHVQMVNDKSHY